MSAKDSEKYYIDKRVIRYAYREETLRHTSHAIKEYFEFCIKNWDLEKFHFHYTKPCIVESTLGWAINRKNQLVRESLWNNYIHKIKPSFLKYFLASKTSAKLKTAIPLFYGGKNYWHFHNDILGQLALADAAGLDVATPVLVSKKLYDMPFFQEVLSMSPSLQARNWVVQGEGENIQLEEAHFFNTFANHRENFDGVLRYIGFQESLRQEPAGNRRIFVGRKRDRGRSISNLDEVLEVLKKYDFDYVECDDLSVRQQIDVFQHAGCIIGIHGAALTNIIYRRDRPMKLLEIFSADFMNPCYYSLCLQYEFEYFGLVGTKPIADGTNSGNFLIDVNEFERQVSVMLNA
jgi:hypothetical protein